MNGLLQLQNNITLTLDFLINVLNRGPGLLFDLDSGCNTKPN